MPDKVPVGTRALVQRINRKLAANDEVLKMARGDRMRLAIGHFYTINNRTNVVSRNSVDLEALGRELGALKPYEVYKEESQ